MHTFGSSSTSLGNFAGMMAAGGQGDGLVLKTTEVWSEFGGGGGGTWTPFPSMNVARTKFQMAQLQNGNGKMAMATAWQIQSS